MDDPNELATKVISETVSDTTAKVLETKVALHLLDPLQAISGKGRTVVSDYGAYGPGGWMRRTCRRRSITIS